MLKHTLKFLTLAVMMFIGGSATTQNQWDEEDILSISGSFLEKSEYCKGISYRVQKGFLKIYDSDFNCVVSLQIGYPNIYTHTNPDGSQYTDTTYSSPKIYCLTKGIMTSSNKFEFILVGTAYDENGDSYVLKGIFNEDGEEIYHFTDNPYYDGDFWDSYNPYIVANKLVVKFKGGNKIFTLNHSIDNQPSTISQIQQQNSSSLYPNPARQSVTLEYDIQGQMQEMQIVDINGRVVANYLLDPSQKQVNINTSKYKKGVYIYRYGNNSGKVVVE